jgi:hypothetical protein
LLAVLAIAGAARRTYADPQSVSLVINPRTGAASLRNDTGAAINIDGYLMTSTTAAFNPATWTSLQDAGLAGWQESNPSNIHLSELNLTSSFSLGAGASRSLGSPYIPLVPTAIGQPETPVMFTYGTPGVPGSILGDVVFSPQNTIVLKIDPASGNATLENQSNFPVNIDALLITSSTGVLDATGWNGLAESGVAGWTAGTGSANRLAEGNLTGSTLLAANGGTRAIGKPINAGLLTDETDVQLEYHVAGGGAVSVVGGVLFAAAGLAGDFNGDSRVDGADFLVWQRGVGGTHNAATLATWKANFGMGGAEAAAGAVPEPAGLALLTIAAAPLMARRRSRE